jgi:hypothetical protein
MAGYAAADELGTACSREKIIEDAAVSYARAGAPAAEGSTRWIATA